MKITKANHLSNKPHLLLQHFKDTLKPKIVKPVELIIVLQELPLGEDCLESDKGWIRNEEYQIVKGALSEMNLTKITTLEMEYKNLAGGQYSVTYKFK